MIQLQRFFQPFGVVVSAHIFNFFYHIFGIVRVTERSDDNVPVGYVVHGKAKRHFNEPKVAGIIERTFPVAETLKTAFVGNGAMVAAIPFVFDKPAKVVYLSFAVDGRRQKVVVEKGNRRLD